MHKLFFLFLRLMVEKIDLDQINIQCIVKEDCKGPTVSSNTI